MRCAEQRNGKIGILDASGELGLSTFSQALEQTGLADTLNNQGVALFGEGSFAVFAPDDEAFSNATDISIIMENTTELKRVLSYHVVWNDGQFSNLSEVSSLQTLEGENLSINATDGLKVNGASVLRSLEYDNGTIYVIDEVLVPEKSTSLDVVAAANEAGAKKFAAAVKSAGFEEMLNGQGPAGIESLSQGPFTIFAPSDAAFDEAKSTVDSISKKEGGTRTLIGYHIVEAKDLLNRTDQGSAKTLAGDSLPIDIVAGLVGGASVLRSQRYDNGIIYVIDQVLVPISAEHVKSPNRIWEFRIEKRFIDPDQ